MKQLIKSLIPPILLELIQKYRSSNYGWHGNYKNWQEAQNASTGYNTDEILQKVRTSLLKVKKGEAVYERDSVLFDEIKYSWPLLSGLMYAVAKSNGVLHVMDFGGSLGSTYFQNKKFLDGLSDVSWNVVEQKHFVEIGKKEFEDNRLKFYEDAKKCLSVTDVNILVLSSVLQYIEKPYALLDELLQFNFKFILVDRTPFASKETITIQNVHPLVYTASYPCWFFEEKKFLNYLHKHYTLVESFNGADGETELGAFKGMILESRNA